MTSPLGAWATHCPSISGIHSIAMPTRTLLRAEKAACTYTVQAEILLTVRPQGCDRGLIDCEVDLYFPGGGPNGFCMPDGPDAALPPPPPDTLAEGMFGFTVDLSGTASVLGGGAAVSVLSVLSH